MGLEYELVSCDKLIARCYCQERTPSHSQRQPAIALIVSVSDELAVIMNLWRPLESALRPSHADEISPLILWWNDACLSSTKVIHCFWRGRENGRRRLDSIRCGIHQSL
jgi:hypothetical protein